MLWHAVATAVVVDIFVAKNMTATEINLKEQAMIHKNGKSLQWIYISHFLDFW